MNQPLERVNRPHGALSQNVVSSFRGVAGHAAMRLARPLKDLPGFWRARASV